MPGKINPYNFVPLGNAPDRTAWQDLSTHERLNAKSYSGHLILQLGARSPIFIPSRAPEHIVEVPCRCSPECRRQNNMKKTFKRFNLSNGVPTIPGSSLKGMIRAVFETLTNSCMALYSGTYGAKTYPAPNHSPDACCKDNGLCLACGVFGKIKGDELHLQGKVCFSDAWGKDSDLETGPWTLKELSSPKPDRHVPFYAADGVNSASGPKGRKFYYHHRPNNLNETQHDHNHRNAVIEQRLKTNAVLQASLDFYGLSQVELAALLYSLELDLIIEKRDGKNLVKRTLAHKIGMGKPIGFGSIGIVIAGGYIHCAAERYQNWKSEESESLRDKINRLKKQSTPLPTHLQDLLSLNKAAQGSIEYPDRNEWFRDDQKKFLPFDEQGFFVRPSDDKESGP